jgi:hypothetical protein
LHDYSSVNVTTLKTTLLKRQLSDKSTKQEIITRLRKSDEDDKLTGDTTHSGMPQDNAILCLDTETSSVATSSDGTTVDSAGSQEVDDDYESVGVPVATTTAGEDDNRIVMDGLGVSMALGQDEGYYSAATGTHSEVTVDGISEVVHTGEILLPQQVTSSSVVQVPPLHLAAL